jgi:putative endonuclease
MKTYYVYILTNKNNTLVYIGVTNNLKRRIGEHKEKVLKGFTYRYNIEKLVYFETFTDINQAIKREKQLKKWKRSWKNELIAQTNKEWRDLYDDI